MQVVPTLVLVHGAGDTAHVWNRTREHLVHPSVAVDLLGRGTRPFDLTRVTAGAAASAVADDVRSASAGPWVVAAHSAGAIVAPRIVAELGAENVRHLVLIAGVTAREGDSPVDLIHPERRPLFEEHRGLLFRRHRNHTFIPRRDTSLPPEGLLPLHEARVVQSIDSLNLMFETISWIGAESVPRTWVRCLRDPIQPPEMQDRLIAASGAAEVREIDTGHTPARDDPAALAVLLDEIAGRSERVAGERQG